MGARADPGLFGMKRSSVPIKDATASGEEVRVPVLKEEVKDAPKSMRTAG